MKYGDILYLKTDPDQCERIITGKLERPGTFLWELTCGTMISYHYDFEVTAEVDVLKKIKNGN